MEYYIKQILDQKWSLLQNGLNKIKDGKYPGVYILAYSLKNLEGKSISLSDVFYVGMSNSRGGVGSRLKQFINGIEKNISHSAGKRFYKEYSKSIPYSKTNDSKKFYFAIKTIPCEVDKNKRTANDIRKMGKVAMLEYYILAHIKEQSESKSEPELNKK